MTIGRSTLVVIPEPGSSGETYTLILGSGETALVLAEDAPAPSEGDTYLLDLVGTTTTPAHPAARPGGPYIGLVGETVSMDGGASYDPDGAI